MKTNYTITNDGDNIIYLDANIINDSPNRLPCSFNINRSSPILPHDNDEYMASVVRFSIPLTSQPLFLFFNDVNIVSVKYNNVVQSASQIFEKCEFNKDENFNIGNTFVGGGIYNYQTMCNMTNTAINTCCSALGLLAPYPYMIYDSVLTRFIIYAPPSWVDTYPYTDPSKPHLYFNKLLQTYFINFNSISYDNTQNNLNCDYLIIIADNKNNIVNDTSIHNGWYYNMQEWNGLQYINSLSNISIVSNNLPCNGDSLNNTSFQKSGFESSSVKVITDFELIKNEAGSQRSLTQYQSQNNRYIDLIGKNKLYNLDIGIFIYYQELINSTATRLYPYQQLILNPYEVVTLKLMFKRKTLNY